MEQEILNEQELPEEGALNNGAAEPEANGVAAAEETNNATAEVENAVENETAAEADEESAEEADGEAADMADFDGEKQVESEDYSKFERPELLTKLNQLINNHPVETIVVAVEEIKSAFYKKYHADCQAAREKFVEQGGAPESFKFADEHQESTFKELYSQFREKKNAYNQKLDSERAENLKKKLEIIEEIKKLVNTEESINKTFQDFRDLQQRWKDVGPVAQSELKHLWDSYNLAVEQFYDYIKINKELRDLDLKENLKAKIALCEKAEALILEDSVVKAFRALQELHDKWRELGPVPNDQREDVWERFKAATTIINKKHQEFFEKQKDLQVQNLAQKTALCERVEEIINSAIDKPKDWEEKSNDIVKIQEIWRTIGYAPKKENSKIYQRFKNDCDLFFAKKREFYKDIKASQKSNMQQKIELCEKAEQLQDSTDWKKTTDILISLQKQWKEVGQIPRKQSEPLWKRFREACDHFFTAKAAHFSSIDEGEAANLNLKLEIIERVKNFVKSDDNTDNLNRLMEIQKEWANVGHVPLNKKDEVQKAFRDAINAQFESLKLEASERERTNFKAKVETWANSQAKGKIYSERNKIVQKMRELENEITLYENNMGFFSKSANSEALIRDINRKIDKAKNYLQELQEKLRILSETE